MKNEDVDMFNFLFTLFININFISETSSIHIILRNKIVIDLIIIKTTLTFPKKPELTWSNTRRTAHLYNIQQNDEKCINSHTSKLSKIKKNGGQKHSKKSNNDINKKKQST